jgi:hypothetical protein
MKQVIVSGAVILSLGVLWTAEASKNDQEEVFPTIEGWTLTKGDIVYTRSNLYELIDGAADLFFSYGFVDLHTARYTGVDGSTVRVEVYRNNSRDNTFGIYSAERYPDYCFISVGTQGYVEDGVLNFFGGLYYVKITTQKSGEAGRAAMSLIARKVDKALEGEKPWPPALALFPQEGKVSNAEGYIAENFLGYKFLRSVFTAEYDRGARYRLFIIVLNSADEARGMGKRYFEAINEGSAAVVEGIHIVNDPNNGPIGLLLEDGYVCGVVNCADDRVRETALREVQMRLSRTSQRE